MQQQHLHFRKINDLLWEVGTVYADTTAYKLNGFHALHWAGEHGYYAYCRAKIIRKYIPSAFVFTKDNRNLDLNIRISFKTIEDECEFILKYSEGLVIEYDTFRG